MSEEAFDSASAIERVAPLEFPYATRDPFLFCVHHDDHYPAGNAELGPKASLLGRNLGQDFVVKDGFRMYHGERVPGFPRHPHRGFETVTVVRNGYVDHSDSMGAAGRYGQGDVQWMTAGGGVQHAEMFPLLDPEHPNRTELFQIWLNLPARSKLVERHFKMIWSEEVPRRDVVDPSGRTTRVTVVAGTFDGIAPPNPPPDSWASHADSDVAIWTLRMDPRATFTLPPARSGTNRTLYFFAGSTLQIGTREIPRSHLVDVRSDVALTLHAGDDVVEILLLQGRPIGEPVVQHGPFVMNSRDEIVQTIRDYQRTEFAGWTWQRPDQVHAVEQGRFALRARGVELLERETFESALVIGQKALTRLGVGPYEARERVHRFRRQNLSSLEAILPHWQDEERRVEMAVSAREQLEAQMELDRSQLALPGSHGWHGETMSGRES